jgi:ORF6N domain
MFQLAAEETGSPRSQSGAFKTGRGKHRKYAPYVFTEQGVANSWSDEATRVQASGNRIHVEI